MIKDKKESKFNVLFNEVETEYKLQIIYFTRGINILGFILSVFFLYMALYSSLMWYWKVLFTMLFLWNGFLFLRFLNNWINTKRK